MNNELNRVKHLLISNYLDDIKNSDGQESAYREGRIRGSKDALISLYVIQIEEKKREKMPFDRWKLEAVKEYSRHQRRIERIINRIRGDE